MAVKKYINLNNLSTFLESLRNTFAELSHKHTISDLTDYTVDAALSSTSANPVQNKVIDAEFEAISTAMNALDLAIDGKAEASHNHNDMYYTESEIDTKVSNINTSITNIVNGTTKVSKATSADSAISANTANTANSATKATQDGNGKVISSTYETKTDASSKLAEAKSYTDTSIDNISEGFSTVIYQMYGDDIGENGAPTIRDIANDEATNALDSAKSYTDTHNQSKTSHSDIRDSVSSLNALVGNTPVSDQIEAAISEIPKLNIENGQGEHSLRGTGAATGYIMPRHAVALGEGTIASAVCSHAEGSKTTASGQASHAEGVSTTASEYASHAEGGNTTASGIKSHAEGSITTASGHTSHAEGFNTAASGDYSHVEGRNTEAVGECSHVQGKYNVRDYENKYAHIVGNGYADEDFAPHNSNAHTLDWNGVGWFAGGLKVGGTSQDDPNAVNLFVTQEDAIELLMEMNLINPVVADDGSIYTDENGAMYTII